MKRFSELNQVRVAVAGLVITAAVLLAAVNIGTITTAITGASYSAEFAAAGGLHGGEEVRISGHTVGEVGDVSLDGNRVIVEFTLDRPAAFGERTRAAIKIENPLGAKFLELIPRGGGKLEPGSTIPLQRTDVGYTIAEALSDLTETTERIDTEQLGQSFETLAQTFSNTPGELGAALQGVRRISQVIASRKEALGELLDRAASVSEVLAQRNGQIVTLLADGNALFAELQRRRQVIHELLVNTERVARQLSGFVQDNAATLEPALSQLRRSLSVLNRNEDDLRKALNTVDGYVRALGESLGGGPWFYGYLQNIVPSNIAPCLPTLFGVGKPPQVPSPGCLQPGGGGRAPR